MKKLLAIILLILCTTMLGCAPDIPDIPVTEQDVIELKEKLDTCITALDEAQKIMGELIEELIEELQKCAGS